MKKCINAIAFAVSLIIIFSGRVSSQVIETHCVVVLDALSKIPVPFATAVCCNYTLGAYGDEFGKICFENKDRGDSIRISALGYQTKSILKKKFFESDTVFLNNVPLELQEVQIKAARRNNRTILAGNTKSIKIQLRTDVLTPNSNTKLATFIPNPTQTGGMIHELHYQLYPKPSEIASSFTVRVRVFSNSARNLPGRDLLLESVIEKVSPEQKWIITDISQHQVPFLAEGVWVGIESVGYTDLVGQYHPLSDFEYGKAITKKGKIKGVLSVTPSYQYSIGKPQTSAEAVWKLKWGYSTFNPKMVLKFGLKAIE